ncbi:glycosyltransferase family 2 protein [Clostridium perfringens]|nr:glycosyltransferase family 2 protein [Clostridium perfringens]MDM0975845.1 glycosyltransferase family 2 protein [Clostridium perfringens]
MKDITAIILTKNEEKNIERCISSIKSFASRIIVVDSYSNDSTIDIAKKMGADIYQHEFVNYASQFNWAIDNTNIKTKWVYRIDADEVVTPELANEICEKIKLHDNDDVTGMVMKFKIFFMGKFLKHGGVYPFYNLTIFKLGKGRYEERKMGEHIVLSEGRSIELENDCLHYDFKDLSVWVAKHNWYSTREVGDYFDIKDNIKIGKQSYGEAEKAKYLRDNIYYKLPLFLRAKLYYIYRYYYKMGFLDGKEGKIYAFLQAYWYRFLVDSKIYECEKQNKRYEDTKDLKANNY